MNKLLALLIVVWTFDSWAGDGSAEGETRPVADLSTDTATENMGKDAEALMAALEARMAGIRTVQTSFVQEKALALLESTIVIEGRMALEGDQLAWHVHAPVKYSVVVADGVMRQWDEDTKRVQRQSLKANPVFQSVMEQLGHWFAGRYRHLRQDYTVDVLAGTPAVQLRFTPRAESAAAKAIQSVTVDFPAEGAYIRRLRIVDLSGDTTTLVFSDTVVNEPVENGMWHVGER